MDLAGSLYDSIASPSLLPAALQRLNQLVGASFTLRQCRDIASGAVLDSVATGPEGLEPQENCFRHWGREDPRRVFLHAKPLKTVFRCHEHLDDRMVRESPFYREWMLPLDLRWTLAARYRVGDVESVIACSRASALGPFEDGAAEALGLLVPHMARASALHTEIDGLRTAADNGHDCVMRLSMPCMLTDQAGRCIETNQSFNASSGKLGLTKVMGRLRFQNAEMRARLERALMETQLTALRHQLSFIGTDQSQWTVHLIPWHMVEQNSRLPVRGMIMAVFDPGANPRRAPLPAASPLHARLTQAEQEVLSGMLRGMSAKHIAQERNSSYNTVRAQIVSILEKTEFSSQKELMAHLGHSEWSESTFSASVSPGDMPPNVSPGVLPFEVRRT